jgi:hypothetical protein
MVPFLSPTAALSLLELISVVMVGWHVIAETISSQIAPLGYETTRIISDDEIS